MLGGGGDLAKLDPQLSWSERQTHNLGVVGSSPTGSTIFINMITLSSMLPEAVRVSNPKDPLWNVYRIHANDLDMNGYTISILPISQVLGSLIAKVIDLKKRGEVVPTTDTTNDGYMYRYILKLSDDLANNNQEIQKVFYCY